MTEKPVKEEKQVSVEESATKLAEEVADLRTELFTAKAAVEKYKKDAQAATARAGKEAKKQAAIKPPTPPAPHDPEADHGHETGKPHYIGAWQRFCPTCGDENPDFKDETQCEDCGAHLGAKETAEKLKACPNCGGHKAKRI